jgi:hypothetical protein
VACTPAFTSVSILLRPKSVTVEATGTAKSQFPKRRLFRSRLHCRWMGDASQTEALWLAFAFCRFQWVGSEILHSFSRHSDGVPSSRFLPGSSLSLLGGSCHVCIMPQATTPRLLDCVSRSPTFREEDLSGLGPVFAPPLRPDGGYSIHCGVCRGRSIGRWANINTLGD